MEPCGVPCSSFEKTSSEKPATEHPETTKAATESAAAKDSATKHAAAKGSATKPKTTMATTIISSSHNRKASDKAQASSSKLTTIRIDAQLPGNSLSHLSSEDKIDFTSSISTAISASSPPVDIAEATQWDSSIVLRLHVHTISSQVQETLKTLTSDHFATQAIAAVKRKFPSEIKAFGRLRFSKPKVLSGAEKDAAFVGDSFAPQAGNAAAYGLAFGVGILIISAAAAVVLSQGQRHVAYVQVGTEKRNRSLIDADEPKKRYMSTDGEEHEDRLLLEEDDRLGRRGV